MGPRSGLSRRAWLLATTSGAAIHLRAQSVAFEGTHAGAVLTLEGMSFRWCPAGRFRMGSPPDEPGRRADEAQVEVALTHGFWMASFETTQGDWRRIVGGFPDRSPSREFGLGDNFPLYWVNYHEAGRFCDAFIERARRAGRLPSGWTVRLPTEAEWEYACRAGTTTATAFGDTLHPAAANFLHDDSRSPAPPGHAVRVGSYAPNAWGLHDMHGNIFEWCLDWYHANLPGGVDPDLSAVVGVQNGDGTYSRVRRGGAWNDPAEYCRSGFRLRYEPDRRSDHIGFRVAIVGR